MATTIGDLQFIISAQTASLKRAQADVDQLKESLKRAAGANSDFSNVGKQVESATLRQVKAFQGARDTIIKLRQKIEELNKAGADTTVITAQMDRAYGRLRSQLERGIITQTKLNTEMDLFKRQTAAVGRGLDTLSKSTKGTDTDLKAMNQRMTDLAKSVQIALGPLSGVASRITAIASLANRNTAAIAGTVAALIAFGHAATSTIQKGQMYESEMKIIENRVKSLGGSIGFTSDQLDQMAKKLGRDTLTNANEARMAIVNLTTATSLSGANFKAALVTAQDLSATGFGDLISQSRRLAQILGEPAEGMERLRDIGIIFTQEQKAVIQTLDATGRSAEAQAIILGELNKRVGGNAVAAAKGYAGAIDTLRERFNEMAENAAKSGGVLDRLAAAVNRITDAIIHLSENSDIIRKFGSLVSSVLGNTIEIFASFVEHIDVIGVSLASALGVSAITSIVSGIKKLTTATIAADAAVAKAGGLRALLSWPVALAAVIGLIVGLLVKLGLVDDLWNAIKGTIESIKISIEELWKTMSGEKIIAGVRELLTNTFNYWARQLENTPFDGMLKRMAEGLSNLTGVVGEAGVAFGKNVKEAFGDNKWIQDTISGMNLITDNISKSVASAVAAQKAAVDAKKITDDAIGGTSVSGQLERDPVTFDFIQYTDAIQKAALELQSMDLATKGVDDSTIKLAASVQGISKAFNITADGIEIVNNHLAVYNERVKGKAVFAEVSKMIEKDLPKASALEEASKSTRELTTSWIELAAQIGIGDEKLAQGLEAIANNGKKAEALIRKPQTALDDQVKTLNAQAKALEKSEKELFVINELLKVDVAGLEEMGIKGAALAAELERVRVAAEGSFDQKERIKQMKSAMQELSSLMERSFDRIGSAITEMFLRGKDEAISFKNVMKAIGSEILQFFIQLAIVNPIKNAFTGGFGGTQSATLGSLNMALSAAGGGAAGSGVGGIGGAGSPGGSGSMGSLFSLSGLLNGLNTGGAGLFATNIASSLGFGNTGQMIIGNAFSHLGFGAIGSLGASLFGLGGGLGGGIGGTAGTLIGSAFGGPVGSAIGGFLGSAIGGLFGGGISRQTGGATVNSRTGAVTSQGGKGDSGDFARQLASGLQDALSSAADLIGADLAQNLLAVRTFANSDRFNGQSPFTLFGEGFNNRVIGNFSSEQDLLQKGVLALLRDPKFVQNVPKEFRQALSQATTLDQFLKMAQEIKSVTEALNGLADTLLNITPFGQQIKELTTNFQSLRTNASLLGLTLADINKAELFHLNSLQLDIIGAINSIPDQARSLLSIDALQAFRDSTNFGSLSPGSPVDKFAAVRASFDQIAQAALSGDQSAIAKLPGIASEALAQGRDVFASGPAFAEFFRTVTSTFDQVLSNQQNLADESGVDLDFTIRETTQLQLAALKELQTQLSKDLQDVRRAIDRNRAR